jgi:hypothetical protein
MQNAKLNYLYSKLERLEIEKKELESIVHSNTNWISESQLLQMDIYDILGEIEDIEDGTQPNNGRVYHKQGDFYVDVTGVDEPNWHGWAGFVSVFFVLALLLFLFL